MTNATSNSKGHANWIPHYNAQLRRLHLRMGQQLSHKSLLQSRLPHSLFVSVISWKTALWVPGMEGQCHSRSCLSQHQRCSQHPPVTSFWGNSEKMEMGRHFKAGTNASHISHPRGALSPSPFLWPSPDPLTSTPVTPHSQSNWLKDEEPCENT